MQRLITHPVLGTVRLTLNPRARRFTARWKEGYLALTIPAGVGAAEVARALDTMAPRLAAARPAAPALTPGQRLTFDGFTLVVELIPRSGMVGSRIDPDDTLVLRLSADVDPADHNASRLISGHILRMARFIAPRLLLPRARAIAQRLGVSPAEWKVGYGSRRLGCCDSARCITLSCMCIFLPARLRDYIICHELAHLSHFNHSAEFHALCSRYCGGDGDQRRAELKAYQWPVPRR